MVQIHPSLCSVLHTFLRHSLHIFSSGGPPPTRTQPGPNRSRAEPAGENRHRWDTVAILFAGISIQGDNHTLRRRPPPRPRLRKEIPILFCRQPPPHPRLRRSSPAPSRRAGAVLAIPGGKPSPGWSRWAAVHWTVGISRLGEGLTGRGNLFPLPCLSRSKHLAPCQPHPARPSAGRLPIHFCRHPHPARAFGAPPPPRRGGGSAWRYQGSSRIRGGASGLPCPVSLRDLPMCWTVGISPLGVAACGEGELVPPPLSLTLQPSYFSPASLARACGKGYPYTSAGIPAPFPQEKGSAGAHTR